MLQRCVVPLTTFHLLSFNLKGKGKKGKGNGTGDLPVKGGGKSSRESKARWCVVSGDQGWGRGGRWVIKQVL